MGHIMTLYKTGDDGQTISKLSSYQRHMPKQVSNRKGLNFFVVSRIFLGCQQFEISQLQINLQSNLPYCQSLC